MSLDRMLAGWTEQDLQRLENFLIDMALEHGDLDLPERALLPSEESLGFSSAIRSLPHCLR